MATVRDAIKARLSRLKDDVLNSTFIKGNVPSREQQLQRVSPQFQRSVQPIARQANIYKSAIGSGLNDIGSGIRNLPQTFSMLKNNPQQFSKGVDLAIDNSLSGRKAGRYALKGAEGFTEGMSLGTYDLPISASRNNYERSAYVGGNALGLINPFNPVNKLAPVFKPASRPLQRPLGHLAGRMIAQGGGKKLLGQGVANLAQGIPYTTAYAVAKTGLGGKYSGKDLATDTGTDLALGSIPVVGGLLIGAKGALKSNGKPIGTMAGDFASTVDKKLRRQISDSLSKVNDKEWTNIRDNLIKTKTGASFLGDLFKHDRLYKAYPEFRKLTVKLDPEYVASATYGSFNPNDYSIRVNPNLSNGQAKSTLLHEIEHAIQTVEDFAKGASYKPVSEGFVNHIQRQKQSLMAQMNSATDPMQRQQIQQSMNMLDRQLSGAQRRASTKYSTEFGEFDARAVESRQNIPQRELTGTDPFIGQLRKEGLTPKDLKASGVGGVNQSVDPLIAEARKYKSAEEFVRQVYGDSTQYTDYNAKTRANVPSGYKNISELGINPEEMITVYRGIDDISGKVKRKINDGDFVTTDFDSALSYTGSPKDVVEMQVKAKHLYNSEPRDFTEEPFYTGAEYIYTSKNTKELPTKSQLTDIWNQANKGEMMSKGEGLKPIGEYKQGEQLINKANPSERVFFNRIDDYQGEQRAFVDYIFNSGGKLRQDTKYVKLEDFQNNYLPTSKNKFNKVNKEIRQSVTNNSSLFTPKEDLAKPIVEKYYPTQPQIDRTRLTGMQLETPNAKLQSPEMVRVFGKGQTQPQLPQPPKTFVGQSNSKNPISAGNVQPRTPQQGVPQAQLGQQGIKNPTQAIEEQVNKLRQQGTGKINTEQLKVSPKTVSSKGIISPEVVEEVKAVQRAVGKKVNLLDYLRTPDRVLKKIGMEKEATLLKQKYNDYLDDLPKEIDKVTGWYNRVKQNKGAEGRIFRYLDGADGTLQGEELAVAKEMQTYLRTWADKLGLPDDKRIASYITHIFEKDFIQKEFDQDLAKLITDRVPSSVYDPFLQERLGKQGYVEDAFRALDAYVKRATRKYHMDQALEPLEANAQKLDLESLKYVTRLGERINMRPTEVDGLLDNLVKSIPLVGYKLGQRPVANASRGIRQMVYRGTLGLNFGSAVRNLTQGVNTYAQLGEKYTAIGYTKALKAMMSRDDELTRVGVLRDNMIQERSLSATKKFWERLDKRLFTFFELAEKINRGSAYYGAKSRALSKGLSEKEAIQAGLEMARKTQFTFGSVDTPVALQGDLVKLVTQFQSFNVKQTEFLSEMAKNKEYAGMVRWAGANLVVLYTVGQAMGWDYKDFIPFSDMATGERPFGETPAIKLGKDLTKKATGGTDKYGQPIGWDQIGSDLLPFVPAGVQGKKTLQGLLAQNRGYSETPKGLVRFPIADTTGNKIRTTLFGQYNTPEAREYFDKDRRQLSEKQSEVFKQKGTEYYNKVMEGREIKKELEKTKDSIKEELQGKTGFKLPNIFGAKKAEASSKFVDDTFYYISGDSVKELDLSKYSSKPTNKIDEIRLNEDRFNDAIKVFRSEDIEDADKETIYSKLGVKKNDLAYYDLATDSPEVRREVVNMVGEREYKDRSEYIRSLASLRLELTSGKRVLTDNIVDDLYNEGLISKNEQKQLKDTKWEKGKEPTNKSANKKKKGTKAPKVKVREISAPSFAQINPVKLSSMVQAQPQRPRVNLQGLKLRVNKPQLRLDPRIRAGL